MAPHDPTSRDSLAGDQVPADPGDPPTGAYAAACTADGDGTRIAVRVSPRAARTSLAGLHGAAVKVRVAAPPADGRANAALCAYLAEVLGVRARAVTVVGGASGRDKVVRVEGVAPAVVDRLLRDAG